MSLGLFAFLATTLVAQNQNQNQNENQNEIQRPFMMDDRQNQPVSHHEFKTKILPVECTVCSKFLSKKWYEKFVDTWKKKMLLNGAVNNKKIFPIRLISYNGCKCLISLSCKIVKDRQNKNPSIIVELQKRE